MYFVTRKARDSKTLRQYKTDPEEACWVWSLIRSPADLYLHTGPKDPAVFVPYHVETHCFKETMEEEGLNETLLRVKESFLVTFHLSKVSVLVFQRGRELERCRKCNNKTQPCDGHHYTTPTTHYCPQHPPTIVVLCNTSHLFNTKQSTNTCLHTTNT